MYREPGFRSSHRNGTVAVTLFIDATGICFRTICKFFAEVAASVGGKGVARLLEPHLGPSDYRCR